MEEAGPPRNLAEGHESGTWRERKAGKPSAWTLASQTRVVCRTGHRGSSSPQAHLALDHGSSPHPSAGPHHSAQEAEGGGRAELRQACPRTKPRAGKAGSPPRSPPFLSRDILHATHRRPFVHICFNSLSLHQPVTAQSLPRMCPL